MNKRIKQNKIMHKVVKLVPFMLVIVVLLLTVGYSAFTDDLAVNGYAVIQKVQRVIRVSGISAANTFGGGVSTSQQYDSDSIFCDIELPNNNSRVSYDVDITNVGNIEMGIVSIAGNASNLKYTINDYVYGDVLCDNIDPTQCTLGSVSRVRVIIEYASGGYDANNTFYSVQLDFTFAEVTWAARIGNVKYERVQKAIDAVPTSGSVSTTITLLNNATERLEVIAGQDITFDFDNYTLYAVLVGQASGYPVIENYGTVRMNNGLISTSASQGAINVYPGGSFYMSGGSIIATGMRQDIYNNGGTVVISGSAYLSNVATERAAVHNLNNGNLTITGGTIIASRNAGVTNAAGTVVIGIKDGNVSTTVPSIRGNSYGVNNSNNGTSTYFKFYDGVISGRTAAIFDETYINDMEIDYGIAHRTDTISGLTYQSAICSPVSNMIKITFDYNDETGEYSERDIESGSSIGSFPNRTRTNYILDGWFTSASGGVQIFSSYTATVSQTFYAHWTHNDDYYVALIGSASYKTLASAVAAITTNASTTIELARDISENIEIPSNKNITIDLQNHILSSPGDAAVIVNKSNCIVTGGTITTNSQNTSAINNTSGANFTITSGSIIATGKRQAIYNDGGRVTITGTAYLETMASERAAVQNVKASGSITITGGTIVAGYFSAVNNAAGTLIIGVKDGNISTTVPVMRGAIYGVTNNGTFKFYDGKIMGVSGAISGNISDKDGTTVLESTEIINGVTYHSKYLN